MSENKTSKIVPLTLELLDEYVRFRQQAHKDSEWVNSISKTDATKQINEQNKDNKTALVVLSDDKIVGQLFITAPTKKRNIAHISLISVLNSEQGTGLAHRLIKKAIHIAEDAECDKLQLIVNKRNTRAIAFYEKQGFYKLHDYNSRAATYELYLSYDSRDGDHEYR